MAFGYVCQCYIVFFSLFHSPGLMEVLFTKNLFFSYADIAKGMKQEGAEADTVSEAEVNRGGMKEATTEDAMVAMSPSYMSDASDAFGNSYQTLSQVGTKVLKNTFNHLICCKSLFSNTVLSIFLKILNILLNIVPSLRC